MTNPWEKYKSSATDADAAAGDGPWKAYAPTGAPGVDWEAGEIKPPSVASTASDLGKSLKAGVQRLPGMAAGLADLPIALATGARPVTQAADYLGKATGFQPGKWADETKFSQGYEDSKKSVDEAWKGFDEVSKDQSTSKMDAVRKLVSDAPQIAGAYLQNPNYTLGQVAESVPSIFAGGALSKVALGVGRVAGVAANAATGTAARAAVPGALARAVGDKWAVPVAAGLGEGAITAGDAMAHAQGPDQQKNALAALGAGAGTALIGAGAGRVANALGLETAETALARAGTRGANGAPTPPASMLRRVLGGMVSEAVLQELPQSAQEQMWQNFAEGKPLWDGVARAGTEGALAGGVMGVAANIRGGQGVPPPGQQDLQARSNAEAAAADAQARADSAQPPWGTSPGAADPNALRATGAASAANAPRVESADFSTSPGAAAPNANGMDFTRDVDTSGLSLQDPAEIARQRAATIDYDPVDTTPAWGTQPGAERPRAGGLDLPSREIDTGTLAIGDRPLSEKMGLNPAAGPLSASAAVAVDSGAYMPPAGTPATDPAAAPEADPMVLQNRDRTSAASIAQMQEIAANPDYLRVGPSRDMTSGAPIVFGEMPPTAILGRAETVVDGKGERMGTQYAVVDAGDLIASNNADGTTVAEYATGQQGKLRSVAGNGRTAGLQAAYDKGTAGKYQQELAADAEALGIDAEALLGMKRPVLVRVMQESEVTNDMGDRTNITATQKLSPREQAGNDARRLDVRRLSFDEGGSPTLDSIQGFVSAMPVAERGDMLNADGTPTRQAVDRLMAATFKQAYDSDELVQLYAQATDPDARAVMAAAADASGVMANLKGAGAFDVRAAVADAAKMAVNAARQGLKLQDVLQNQDMDMNPDAFPVAAFMAQNIRTPKKMAEGLRRWGQLALEQARIAEENTRQGGMFGAAPTLSRQEIFARLGDSNNPAQQSIAPAQAELASADSQTPQSNPNGDPNEPSPNQAEQTEAQPTQSGTAQDSVAAPAKPNPRGVLAKLEAMRAQRKAAAEAKSAAAAPAQAEPLQLESYTEGELRAQAQAQDDVGKARAKQEAQQAAADKARTDQAEVDARMGASSDNFVLGQDANDAVSGQDSVLDAPAEQAPAAAPVTAAPEARAKTPAPRKLSVPEKARQAQEAARADYFAQGNIVKSYSGHDRVVGYQPTEGPSASWSATVQAVEKQGGQWVDVPGTSPRTHATQPDAREMKAGPVKRGLGATKTESADAEQASGAGSNEANAPMFSRAQAKEVRNLVTLHNLSEENLLYADSIGGIPAPSIGITKVDSPFGGFGGITLIAPKGMIDPEAGVPVYDRDAWTARFPAMNFKRVKAAAADAFYGRMKSAKALGDDGDSFVSMLWERVKNDSTQSPGKVMELFRQYQAARVLYAREVLGREIKVPMRDVPLSGPMAQDKQLLAHWKAHSKALVAMRDEMSTSDFRATPEFQQLSGQVEAALERAWPNEDRPGKREALRKTFREVLFDDDGLMSTSAFRDLARDAAKVGIKEIDRVKLGAALDKVVKRDDPAYLKWAESLVAPLFEPPTITLRGREVAPTLENLTQAMTVGATEGVEKSMAFGAGKTAAMLGKRFKSFKEIQASRDQVVSQAQEQEGKKSTDVVLDAYREAVLQFYTERDWRGQIDTWAGNDAAMEALARAGKIGDSPVAIRAALAKMGFKSVDAESLRLARQAIDALRNAATDYFEAKPQRAVGLNEFKGAVVPKGTSAEAMAVLEKNGIEIEVHGKAEGAREKAIQKMAKRLDQRGQDVLFSMAGQRAATADTHALASAQEPANAGQPGPRQFQPLANQSSAKALNDTLVKYGLGQDWSTAYEAVKLPDALSGIRDAIQVAFGRNVRSVAPTAARFNIFNGVYLPSRPGDVYVNAASDVGFVNIAGHELWHAIKRQRPGLIDWYRTHSRQYYKDLPAYRDRLNALVQDGEKKYSALAAEEELEADFMGDALADPAFLQQLADASPSKFRVLLDHVQRWLAGVANKLKGLGSSKEVTDVQALQKYLKEVLVAFAEGKDLPGAPADIAPRYSRAPAADQTQTDAFKKWFAGSKVVDADGQPLRVYHGTRGDFDAFDLDARPANGLRYARGVYMTADPGYASMMSRETDGSNVMPVYASLQRPRVFTSYTEANAVPATGWSAIEAKHDGVIILDEGVFSEVIAFAPEQVKSATGNSGEFDLASPDIRFSRATAAITSSMGVMNADQEQAYRRVAGTKKVPTLKERMASLKANFGLKARQALVDQFAAIKQLDQKAYMQARMSKASDGALEATLLYGKPFLRDGVPDVDIRDGGFAKVLASLNGEHDRWMMWIAAQRAERLKTEGKENLMTDDDISALKSLNAGKMANGAMRLPVYANALKELNAYNEAMLTMSMQSGLIDQDTVDLMRDQPYVPFYRLMEDADFEGPRFSSGLKNQQAWKKLKGGTQQLNADLLQNTLMNWSHLLQASARNRAALATMDAAEGLAIAYKVPATTNGRATKDAVKVMRNGKTEHWTVEDPYLLEAVGALNYTVSPLMKPLTKMKQILTMAVTVNPTFKIRNLIRDSVSAIAQSELGYNPAANVGKAWKLTAGDSQIYASMLAGGGIIKFGTQENTDRLRKQVEKLGGQVLDKKGMDKLTGQVGALWDAYSEFGDRTENVNRVALYDQLIKKGHSHAEASFMARDLMDFSMGGAMPLVRFLTQTVPFLNARLVGLDKLGRAAMDDPRKFATVAAAVSLASLALLAMYGDDDDWKEREDWDRDTYWWFKIGDTAFRIPKPFEVGAIGTMAERTAELMFSEEMTSKRFAQRMGHMFSQTFAFDPIPQAIKPLLDVYSNKDSFTKRAIETPSEQRMKPADRYNERTSETAKLLGQLGLPEPSQLIKGDYMAMSPKQIDHLIRGYFSWVGVTATSAADMLVRPLMDKGDKPDMQLRDMFLVGNFAQGLPAGSSRYVTQMYEQSRQVQQAYASYQNALKLGDMDKARDIQETDGDKLRSRMAYTRATEQMAALGQQAKRVEASRTMTGEEKRQRLDEIARQRNAIAKRTSGLTM